MRFTYSPKPDKEGTKVTVDTLFAAADEIHRYCKRVDEGPLVVAPRTQRVWASFTGHAFVSYPLTGSFTVTDPSDDDEDISDDCEQVSEKLISIPKEHRKRYLEVEGEAGWGYTEQADSFTSALAADATEITVASGSEIEEGWVLRLNDELMVVTGRSGTTITLLRGAGGTTAAAHEADAGGVLSRVRPPALLEDAALGIAQFLAVRKEEPSRGVARSVQVQDGFRLVRTDPLAAFRPDLKPYVR